MLIRIAIHIAYARKEIVRCKMDNKKLKKEDSKRISLHQSWELAYIKRISYDIIKKLRERQEASSIKIMRICRFAIKAAEKLKRLK